MRTPLLCKLRVTISPWKSSPDFLKVPIFAMSTLLGCNEPATIAASMAICRPKVIAAAPVFGPERSGGWQRRELSWLARNGQSPGEESRAAAIAAQAIEAQ